MRAPVATGRAAAVPAARPVISLPAAGGLGVLCGELLIFLGTAWDIQWHVDVGPDTFFTAPHLLIYTGAALTGLVSLAVVLASTYRTRQPGLPTDPAVVPLLWRTFWAPAGFVLSGTGAALWLAFGAYDEWWHTIYGFDVTLDSPPHVGLALADVTAQLGVALTFTLLAGRATQARVWQMWPAFGLATSAALLMGNSLSFVSYTWIPRSVAGVADVPLLLTAALYGLVLLAVVSVVRRPGAATLTGVVFTVLLVVGGAFPAWATPAYAEFLGLVLRDNAVRFPLMVALLPKGAALAGVLVDLVLAVARRRGAGVRVGVTLAAGVGVAALTGVEVLVLEATGMLPVVGPAATVLAAGVVGAAAGWAGWKLGVVARRVAAGSAAFRNRKEGA